MIKDIATEIVELQERKNHDYGNAFEKSMDKWGLTALAIRLGDKLSRLESLIGKENKVDESLEDTLIDLASYAMMGVEWLRKGKKEEKEEESGFNKLSLWNKASLLGIDTSNMSDIYDLLTYLATDMGFRTEDDGQGKIKIFYKGELRTIVKYTEGATDYVKDYDVADAELHILYREKA